MISASARDCDYEWEQRPHDHILDRVAEFMASRVLEPMRVIARSIFLRIASAQRYRPEVHSAPIASDLDDEAISILMGFAVQEAYCECCCDEPD